MPRTAKSRSKTKKADSFLAQLQDEGITVEIGLVLIDLLEPSPQEFGKSSPFIVSLDGFVINCHTRLAGMKKTHASSLVPIRLVHLSRTALLGKARRFHAPEAPVAKAAAKKRAIQAVTKKPRRRSN